MNPTPGVSPGTSILLTGGAGFIGSHLAERLLGAGAHVTILDNLNDPYATHLKQENLRQVSEQGSFDFLQVDIANPEQLQSALSGKSYDAVIHLAARTGVRSSLTRPLLYGQVNLQGTLGLLELARRGMCRQFIFGSSSLSETTLAPRPPQTVEPIETMRLGDIFLETQFVSHSDDLPRRGGQGRHLSETNEKKQKKKKLPTKGH